MGKYTKRQEEYGHERAWKQVDPAKTPTPLPAPEHALAGAMRSYLESRELDYDTATRLAGWYPAFYRGPRIIIPCVRSDGGVWWQGRLIETPDVIYKVAHGGIFDAKRWDGAYGYRHDAVCYISAEYERPTIIVEGPMDALAAAGCGFPAIAILGASPPNIVYDQVARLVNLSYHKDRAIIIPDNDRLGAWVDTQNELGARGVYARIQQIISGAKDLAELSQQDRVEFLNA